MSPRLQRYYNNLNESNVDEFVQEFVKSDCPQKIKLKVTDKLTRVVREVYVPCGKCLYCRARRIADWTSRMCLHTQFCRKYVYFVTLTYRTFGKYNLIPSPLLDAYWRYDNLNKTHHYGYSPCLLRHEHFQRFMKYLRKQYPVGSLDFFMCGEMGEKYGRPHFHCILWSDNPLSIESLRQAWSVNISKSRKHPNMRSIGNVRLDDLQSNGTLASKGGRNAFRYVAKYCCKSFIDSKYMQKSRFGLFLNDLRTNKLSDAQLRAVFSNRINNCKSLVNDFAFFIAPFLRSLEHSDFQNAVRENEHYRNIVDPFFKKLYQLNNKRLYEHVPRYDDRNLSDISYISQDWFSQIDETRLYQIMVTYYQKSCNNKVLENIFSPYCISSRSNAIGKQYALANIEDFARGRKNLPQACNSTVFFPRYFDKLTEQYITRYYRLSPKVCSSDIQAIPLACDLYNSDYIQRLINQDFDLLNDQDVFSPYGYLGSTRNAQQYLKQGHCLKDSRTHTRMLLCVTPDSVQFDCFKYSRSSRSYVYHHSVSIDELLNTFLSCRNAALNYNAEKSYQLQQTTAEYTSILESLKLVCNDYIGKIEEQLSYAEYIRSNLHDLDMARNTNPLNE